MKTKLYAFIKDCLVNIPGNTIKEKDYYGSLKNDQLIGLDAPKFFWPDDFQEYMEKKYGLTLECSPCDSIRDICENYSKILNPLLDK